MNEKMYQKIHKIADELKSLPTTTSGGGLLSGKIGIALFFVHYAKYTNLQKDEDFAFEFIQSLLAHNYCGKHQLTYSGGISGLGWFLEHLNAIGFADVDTEETLGDFDSYMGAKMCEEIASYNFDFLHGGLGVFFYFTYRKQSITIQQSLISALTFLEEIAIKNKNKISWLALNYRTKLPMPGEHNLGLAHGVPGILSVLCCAFNKVPSLRGKLKSLISRATNFILWCFESSPSDDVYTSYFPYAYKETEPFTNSRLGWCYGDLGVVLSLRSANLILNEPQIDLVIQKILQRSAKRKSLDETKIFDAGLCHGSAGVAHIYNSFYQQLRLPYLKEAADYWYLISLENANFINGPAGYKSYQADKGFINSYGFLEGIAGVGLAYISYLNNDFSWDKSLLISV
ncbi:hypothetical protein DHW03_15020 [Pedobacter yonginense]|uniref:Lanthionine synthetase n=1 Tax=Pedobacter yonginense TaxID=651869 RepID=A0A317EM46_9SPHI|nr:lanthionine synthetase C family protein [Pedobacter yonginense]PWS26108.1 hypothetical protein DHW03_15020 [Pedobacter yonginense]